MTNEQIARDVMQWEIIEYDNGVTDIVLPDGEVRKSGSVGNYHDFLNDHNAAMMVVEKMREDGWLVDFHNCSDGIYVGMFENVESGEMTDWFNDKSLPALICFTALRAKGIDIESKDCP